MILLFLILIIQATTALRPWFYNVEDCDDCTVDFCVRKGASPKWGECFQPTRDTFTCRCAPDSTILVNCSELDYVDCITYQSTCFYLFTERKCILRSTYLENKVQMCKSRRKKKNCNRTRGCYWKRTNSTCLFK